VGRAATGDGQTSLLLVGRRRGRRIGPGLTVNLGPLTVPVLIVARDLEGRVIGERVKERVRESVCACVCTCVCWLGSVPARLRTCVQCTCK